MRVHVHAFASCALLLGCDEFDAALKSQVEDNVTAEMLELANLCGSQLPHVEGSAELRDVQLEGLTPDVSEGGDCDIKQQVLDEAEGFFEISATEGDRWHFHLEGSPRQDLAIFVSGSCDPRECLASSDVCAVGEPEHFTFVAPRSGRFVVAVEGVDERVASTVKLTVINPECGDGVKDHGEVCDDDNTMSGDGCDGECRVEIAESGAEVEPNDDSFLANVLAPAAGKDLADLRIDAKIGGSSCQPDYFLVHLPRGSFTAEVQGAGGASCRATPPLELALVRADQDELRESFVRATATSKAGECPRLSAIAVEQGPYYVRLKQLASGAQFSYQLRFE